MLLRLAESPNAYPWSVDTQSKLEGTGAERTPDNDPPPIQTIVKLKLDKKINKRQNQTPMSLNMLQSIEVQESLEKQSEKGSSKDKPKNVDKERKK
jgi:hypothetical protein